MTPGVEVALLDLGSLYVQARRALPPGVLRAPGGKRVEGIFSLMQAAVGWCQRFALVVGVAAHAGHEEQEAAVLRLLPLLGVQVLFTPDSTLAGVQALLAQGGAAGVRAVVVSEDDRALSLLDQAVRVEDLRGEALPAQADFDAAGVLPAQWLDVLALEQGAGLTRQGAGALLREHVTLGAALASGEVRLTTQAQVARMTLAFGGAARIHPDVNWVSPAAARNLRALGAKLQDLNLHGLAAELAGGRWDDVAQRVAPAAILRRWSRPVLAWRGQGFTTPPVAAASHGGRARPVGGSELTAFVRAHGVTAAGASALAARVAPDATQDDPLVMAATLGYPHRTMAALCAQVLRSPYGGTLSSRAQQTEALLCRLDQDLDGPVRRAYEDIERPFGRVLAGMQAAGLNIDHAHLDAAIRTAQSARDEDAHLALERYLLPLARHVRRAGGRARPTWDPLGTRTGHAAAREPAVQTWPVRRPHAREARRCVIPEAGHVFVAADYDQLELRVLAYLAQDDALLAAFQAGVDVHARTAALVFGVSGGALTAEQRQVGKLVNYGVVFGMGAGTLARQTGMTQERAAQLLVAFHDAHPAVRRYAAQARQSALRHGYAEDAFGRRRQLPLLTGSDRAARAAALRSAAHSPVAMTAAGLFKGALVRAHGDLMALGARVVLINRDEVLVDTPPHQVNAVVGALRRAMVDAAPLPVPLAVHVGVGANWLDAKLSAG